MDKNQVESVKVYFIQPADVISILISSLVSLEYEAYSVHEDNKEKLLDVIENDIRNVVFLCILNIKQVDGYLEYINQLKKFENTKLLIGAFVFDKMDDDTRSKFLIENVSVINLGEVQKSPLNIMKQILIFFEAKGRRLYVKTKTSGKSEVFFYFPNINDPITGIITDISVYAFSCELDEMNKNLFSPGSYISDSLLVLGGKRIKTAVKVMGFSQDNPNVFMFKYCSSLIENNKYKFIEHIDPQLKVKVHDYIRWCLNENLSGKINKIEENKTKEEVSDKKGESSIK